MEENKIINSLLAEREKSRISLEKKLVEVNSEIKVLKLVLSRMGSPTEKNTAPLKTNSRGRKLDIKWQKVLQFIGSQDGVSVNTIMDYIQMNNYPISKSNLRVQLNSYTQKDWVRRNAQATYVLTKSGIERCGYSEKAESSVAITTKDSDVDQDSGSDDRIAHLLNRSLGTNDKKRSYN